MSKIKLFVPFIDDSEKKAVVNVLKSNFGYLVLVEVKQKYSKTIFQNMLR